MKILIVTSFFPLSNKDKIPQFLLEQVKALALHQPDSKIVVLTSSRSGEKDKVIADNVMVKRFSYFWPMRKQNLTNMGILPALKKSKWNLLQLPLLFLFEFIAIYKEINRVRPDFIYSHWFLPQGLLCYLLAKRYKIPHVFTSHSYDVEICKRVPIIGSKIVRSAVFSMKAITVVSQRTLEGIASFFSESEWLILSKKFKVIPMGINLPSQKSEGYSEELKENLGYNNKKIVFFMGRFVPKKGIYVLLKSMVSLIKADSSVILVLAGDGILKKDIESKVVELGLCEYVLFPWFITSQEKESFLRVADLFVLPSINALDGDREGLPVSLLESLSYGKLCVATNESGAEEILDSGENGFICKADDSDKLFNTMIQALSLNDTERNRIQHNAFKKACEYSWPTLIQYQAKHFFDRSLKD